MCLVDRGGCLAAEWRHEAPQARASALRQLLYARRKELLYDNTPLRATLAAAGAAAAASANAGVLAVARRQIMNMYTGRPSPMLRARL